ncbi:helix-turn-helix transcriptional regulator [Schinkia azotoformans]|uniref:helix-turn-helix transcriptional regulator n=1 Tax=Schinkia azotoformans TaxID=1454 RepID=UPI002DBF6476|nr:helix-turn-helix transcriptional regulator [Schinkia azotoformans]MEC1778326.1 helix-turn-helix transcriptional regulator [Schinkia azotoformans]MED4331967.1 helix-turn-helix transcriptional regulator [Schinkia azotoformans]
MPAIYIDSLDFSLLKEMDMGQRLKFFRQKNMQYDDANIYTTTAIAERLNITPQTISAIERGISKKPSFSLIHELTKEFGVPLEAVTDEFYQGKEKLFTIGKPQVVEIDIDFEDDFDIEDLVILDRNTPTTGLLLYNCNSHNNYEVLYINHFTKTMTDDEISRLSMRLALEASIISDDDFSPTNAIDNLNKSNKLVSKFSNSSVDLEELNRILSFNPKNTGYTEEP